MNPNVFMRRADGSLQEWRRTRIRELEGVLPPASIDTGSNEAFFEELLSREPALLGIATPDDDSDIDGPLVCFRKRSVRALNGRTIFPDLIILSQSGHVAIVEVKLGDNTELKDRRVVAQVLEYAASLADLSEKELLEAICAQDHSAKSWPELVKLLFPRAANPDRIARRLLARFRNQDLLLAIACDEVPIGLRELVANVVGQNAVGEYRFRVIEIAPFVAIENPAEVILLPNVTVETAIVARTSVTVTYAEGQAAPGVAVEVTSLEDAEAHRKAAVARTSGRKWDEQSFFEDAESRLPADTLATIRTLYERMVERHRIKWGSGKTVGSFSPIIESLSDNSAFSVQSDGLLFANFGNMEPECAEAAKQALAQLRGVSFNIDKSYPRIDGWVPHSMELYDALASVGQSHGAA